MSRLVLPSVALSFRQPWAWLIVHGHKDVENRTWYRGNLGTFLVHASKSMTKREYDDAWDFCRSILAPVDLPPRDELLLGGIVGVTTHTGRVLSPARTSHSWHMEGQFGYMLRDSAPLPFVPCSGRLGLWPVPPSVLEALSSGA